MRPGRIIAVWMMLMVGASCRDDAARLTSPVGPMHDEYPSGDELQSMLWQLKFDPHTDLAISRGTMGYVQAIGQTAYFGNVVSVSTRLNVTRGSQSWSEAGSTMGFDVVWPQSGTYRTDAMVNGIYIGCGLRADGRTGGYAKLKGPTWPSMTIGEWGSTSAEHIAHANTDACTPCQNDTYRNSSSGGASRDVIRPALIANGARRDLECDPASGDDGGSAGQIIAVCFDAYLVYEGENGVKGEEYLGQWCYVMDT